MKHFHILRRVKLKSTSEIFMCADPECSWSRRKEFIVGKKFLCPYCNNLYLVDLKMLTLKTPHCANCTAKKTVLINDPLVSKLVDGIIEVQPMSEVIKGEE